jgi:hypothetical protein
VPDARGAYVRRYLLNHRANDPLGVLPSKGKPAGIFVAHKGSHLIFSEYIMIISRALYGDRFVVFRGGPARRSGSRRRVAAAASFKWREPCTLMYRR